MGQEQSKDQLLYEQVNYANTEAIKSLRSQGAGLEYVDKRGKTPLIASCMKPELYDVAQTLIELGANVNAYCPGRYGGTPLHHAAKQGIERTVKLLLLHGANALMINDDGKTPLEIARAKGFGNIVHLIESQICLFAGWLRELYGPGFLGLLAPQLLSREVWVVVLPCGSRNLEKPFKLELAIYANSQDAKPRTTIALWKANMEETAAGWAYPAVIISEASAMSRRRRRRRHAAQVNRYIRIKLAPANEGDHQQLQQFRSACKGIPQVAHSTFPFNTHTLVAPATAPPVAEDVELAMAISASMQSSTDEGGIPIGHSRPPSGRNPSTIVGDSSCTGIPLEESYSRWEAHDQAGGSSAIITTSEISIHTPTPVNAVVDHGPIRYPSVDSSTVNRGGKGGGSSSCVICLDASVEGACVPCGHMVGCMSCLNEIKAKKWGCPICRSKIEQVIRVYAV